MNTLELEARADALARSNHELEQFAYVASHDLKEPLRVVRTCLELLARRQPEADATSAQLMGHAVDACRRMGVLIDGLLEVSRVDAASPSEVVDLTEVVAEVMADLAADIADSGASIQCGPLPLVRADRVSMGRVLQNLVANAIKFRQPDTEPRVRVWADAGPAEWTVTVADDGIGVDPRFVDEIFAMFRRLHPRGVYPGSGIGLGLCRRVIDRHGGRIWVEPGPDGGSRFRFTLPNEESR